MVRDLVVVDASAGTVNTLRALVPAITEQIRPGGERSDSDNELV